MGGAGGVGPPPMMKWGGANLKRGVKSEKFLRRAPPPKTHSSTDPPQQFSLSPPLPANLRPPPSRLADEKVKLFNSIPIFFISEYCIQQ